VSIPLLSAPKPNDKVCQALAKVLADAKRGDVQLVGIIAIGEDGRPRVLFGGEADLTPSLNLGLDMLKATIMAQIVTPPSVRRASEAPAIEPASH
jgi:hypothetical protein